MGWYFVYYLSYGIALGSTLCKLVVRNHTRKHFFNASFVVLCEDCVMLSSTWKDIVQTRTYKKVPRFFVPTLWHESVHGSTLCNINLVQALWHIVHRASFVVRHGPDKYFLCKFSQTKWYWETVCASVVVHLGGPLWAPCNTKWYSEVFGDNMEQHYLQNHLYKIWRNDIVLGSVLRSSPEFSANKRKGNTLLHLVVRRGIGKHTWRKIFNRSKTDIFLCKFCGT